MAGFGNPVRTYRFRVEIDGLDQWAIQQVKFPELEVSVVEHGGGDTNIKTASKKLVGNAVLSYLKNLDGTNKLFAFNWITACTLGLPTAYKRNIVVKELGNDGITTVRTEIWVGCFAKKCSRNDGDRLADENVIESLEISVDDVIYL